MSKTKVPSWFKITVILAVLWNLAGIFSFFLKITLTQEYISGLPAAEQALLNHTPLWTNIAFALVVYGGAIGSIGLLIQKAWARLPLLISLIAVFLQMSYWLFFTTAVEVYGSGTYIMPVSVILIAYLLFSLCNKGIKKGYIT